MKNIAILVLCIVFPLMVGGLSGYITTADLSGWYATIEKPFFNPPNYIFGPVWTVLYILMGVSLYLNVIAISSKAKETAIALFALQITLNFWWSIIFFYFQSPFWALVVIVALLLSILAMIVAMKRVNLVSAYLQIPYLCWVNFAAILNAAIWYLNSK